VSPTQRWPLAYLTPLRNERHLKFIEQLQGESGELVMWGGAIGLIIQLIAGAAGGNITGSLLKQFDLGVVGNSIAGVVGGGIGAQVIGAIFGAGAGAGAGAAAAGGLDIGSIIGQIVAGGAGGGILMVIVGLIKQAMSGQKLG
jgi:hypothetical protein